MLFELVRKVLHQNISLDRVLSDSGQNCLDFSPIENYHFGWGRNFVPYQDLLTVWQWAQ